MTTFQVGRSYATRSLVDYDRIFSFTILARTSKAVSVKVGGAAVRRGIKVRDGVETFKPFGTHSMFPIVYAEERAAALAQQSVDDGAKAIETMTVENHPPTVALAPSRAFDVEIHWTPAGAAERRKTVVKVMGGDWAHAIDLAMRAVRSDETVPLDAKVSRIIP